LGIELQRTAAVKVGGQKAEKKKYLYATHPDILLIEE
jgi:hypothetical protein